MKMKQQLWNLRFGNKAFVFSLDATFALILVITILAIATYYSHIGYEYYSNTQLTRTASDILAVLDHKGILDRLNSEEIESSLTDMLPVNYGIMVNITTYTGTKITLGNEWPEEKFIAAGERIFVISDEGEVLDYGIARYWVWLK